jgi:hypothetical protein
MEGEITQLHKTAIVVVLAVAAQMLLPELVLAALALRVKVMLVVKAQAAASGQQVAVAVQVLRAKIIQVLLKAVTVAVVLHG